MPAPTFHHCGEIEDELNNSVIFDIARKAIEDAEHERDSAGNSHAKQRHAAQAVLLFQTALMSLERTVPVIAREEAALERMTSDLQDHIEDALNPNVVNIRTAARERVRAMFASCPEVQPETAA